MVNLQVDFSGIEKALGDIGGIADGIADQTYLGNLISAAHNVASREFDIDAAATAAAGNMTLVYEFGVRGITRGQPKFSDPTDPAARLWVHQIAGAGRSREIGFVFRPAVQPNPRPSAEFYGVSSEVIKRLSRRKYVFWNKAAVNEYGITVHIKPKEKPFNFVPFYGKPRNPKYKRGYVFRYIDGKEPMESTPGEAGATTGKAAVGTFSAFWQMWWNGRGQELLTGDVNIHFNRDVLSILERYPETHHAPESILRYNSRGRVYNRRRRVKARMVKLAAERGNNRRRG